MIPEPDFTGIDSPDELANELNDHVEDVMRLNDERIRLRKWINHLMEWSRATVRADPHRTPIRPDAVVAATELALGSGEYPPMG